MQFFLCTCQNLEKNTKKNQDLAIFRYMQLQILDAENRSVLASKYKNWGNGLYLRINSEIIQHWNCFSKYSVHYLKNNFHLSERAKFQPKNLKGNGTICWLALQMLMISIKINPHLTSPKRNRTNFFFFKNPKKLLIE